MKNLKFKDNDCFICGLNNSSKTIYKKKAFDLDFEILNCNDCDTNYINKVPKDSFTYSYIYDFGGMDSKIDIKNILTRLRIIKAKRYLKRNSPEILSKTLTILDYGSGDGYLSYTIKELNQNTDVYATDYIKTSSPFYENVNFINFDNLFESSISFDIIILRHVLEHIEEPKSVIEELMLKLNKNGYILIEVPNHDLKSNYFLKTFKSDYNQIGLPWHFNHFNVTIFKKMFKQYRLEFSKNSIPVLGQSLMMKFNKNYLTFDGTGFIALVSYPVQIFIDYVTSSYTAIILKIYK